MSEDKVDVNQLNSAKERLRDALTRLEAIVENKLESSGSQSESDIARELGHTREALKEKHQELEALKNSAHSDSEVEHLRQENQKLQAEVGRRVEESKDIKRLNKRVSVRVDSLISELEAVLLQ